MVEIRLDHQQWSYDPDKPLGPRGGFGRVYEGTSEEGRIVAVKKLHIDAREAGHRELDIAQKLYSNEFQNVLGVLDSGIDANTDDYFIVMDKAECSLADQIEKNGSLPEPEVIDILLQICSGLSEVGNIVHRDLKPENILLHEGKWKIADFGIARFVEESTSARTLKDCLSPQYASPEQWKFERSAGETDIYALGCIAHFLATGSPPFSGPDNESLKEQHLNVTPEVIDTLSPKTNSIIRRMLRKVPNARLTLTRCISLLEQYADEPAEQPKELNALAKANENVARRAAEEEAAKGKEQERINQRAALRKESFDILEEIADSLCRTIRNSATEAKQPRPRGPITLGHARLEFNFHLDTDHDRNFPETKWDVVASATIRITQFAPQYVWESNLLFADKGNGEFRWYEVGLMTLGAQKPQGEPFAADLQNIRDLDLALSNVMHVWQPAWGPVAIDLEDQSAFMNRWILLFSKASEGQLSHPSRLPIPEAFFDQQ